MTTIYKRLKLKIKNNVRNLRNKAKHFTEMKQLPKSKRKSALLGMVTVLSIFGITMVAASLPVIAQDAPGPDPPPASGKGLTCSSNKPSKEIIKALGGAATTVCSLAITSGSFFVGAVCGVVVVYGILKTQGK